MNNIRINETFFEEAWLNSYNLDPVLRVKYEKKHKELSSFSWTSPPVGDFKDLHKYQWSEEFKELVLDKFKENSVSDRVFQFNSKEIERFLEYCKNRMLQGAYRYGRFDRQTTKFDHLSSIELRYRRFWQTLNCEYLIDIYNLYLAQWLDKEKDSKLIKFAFVCITVFLETGGFRNFKSIDNDNVHSEKE